VFHVPCVLASVFLESRLSTLPYFYLLLVMPCVSCSVGVLYYLVSFANIYYMSSSSWSPSSASEYRPLFLRWCFGVFGQTSLFRFVHFDLRVVHSVAVRDISVRFDHLGASMDFLIMGIFVL